MHTEQPPAQSNLRPGVPVEVATHYTGTWTSGFEVAALHADTCRVRRVSDGVVLPVEFDRSEVRVVDHAPDIAELIGRFARATRPSEIQAIADELGGAGDH